MDLPFEKYITKISLRGPAQGAGKTGAPERGKRASARIYEDMISAYQYADEVGLYDGIRMARPDITISASMNTSAQNLGSAAQQAAQMVQGLASMGQAAASAMRNISDALNALRAQVNAAPDPMGEIRDRVYADAVASQMSTQEIIEQLLSEYERREGN